MQYKVNHAELSYSFPTLMQSARMIQGEIPISENCPETWDLPISHPVCLVNSWEAEMDESSFSSSFKIFTMAWVSL